MATDRTSRKSTSGRGMRVKGRVALQLRAKLEGVSLELVERSVNPMRRLLEPEEVAEMAVYLASEASGGVTGQALNIDGGNAMH